MCAIVIVAFLLRTVFVYGLSAGGGYALSGGTSAQNHLHVVESILNGTFVLGSDAAIYYPTGGLNVVPILMDLLAAGVATIFGAFGMTTAESASAALAILPPVFGALACIPVYAIGKELFNDKRIGVISALVFAFLSLPISSSVFSNGTEYALTAFLISCMSYTLIKTVRLMESDAPGKKVYSKSIVSGILLGLVALAWNGFGLMILVVGVPLMLQIGIDRINGKNFTKTLVGHSLTLIVGIAIAAVYYIPANLWDAVFSGPLLLTVLIVVFGFLFRALQSKPWITVIPSLLVVLAVFLVALNFVEPELFSAVVLGNSPYTGILSEMVTNHVSMSNVSSYYGWLTMWLPLCLAIYETYVYLKKDRSASQLFMVTWLYVMYFAVWSSYSSAAVIGSVFAVGSGAVIVKVLSRANIPDWVRSIKANGFKKIIKPFPLAAVLITAFLVVAPNLSYAVDAGIPSNDDSEYYFSGNTQFLVKTGDSYPMGDLWKHYSGENKNAAVVWIDYVADAVSQGNFKVLADTFGEGSEETASMILAKGSQGMTAALMLRLIMADGIEKYKDDLTGIFSEETYNVLKSFIDDPCKAKEVLYDESKAQEYNIDISEFGKIRSDVTDSNAIYLASTQYLVAHYDVTKISKGYDKIREVSKNAIDYVILDPSLLPLSYRDGSSFSTMAYFAGYSTDGYGAATQFFSYNQYYGSTVYTDAIYDTFLWKAMIGPSASQAGFSNSYSYLQALSSSDGSVKAYPGYGLSGYKVDYWQVMYNADKDATSGSDGWIYMSIDEALSKQKADGGRINYLSSIIAMKYVGIENREDVHIESSTSVSGLVLDVYTYDGRLSNYVLASSTVVGEDGNITIPKIGADDKVVLRNGSVILATAIGHVPPGVTSLPVVQALGVPVTIGEGVAPAGTDLSVVLVNVTTKKDVRSFPVEFGFVNIQGVLPGEYTVDIRDSSGTSVSSSAITLVPGDNSGLVIKPTTYNITVTVKDIVGRTLDETSNTEVIAKETTTGAEYRAMVGEDGKAVIAVIPGTYSVYTDRAVAPQSTTITRSNSSVSLTVGLDNGATSTLGEFPYPAYASSGSYSYLVTYESGSSHISLPDTDATDKVLYTIYGTDGKKVILDTFDGGLLELSEVDAIKVTGKTAANSTVMFVRLSDGATVTAIADKDGNYSLYLPKSDEKYIINAYSGENKAYLGIVDIKSGEDNVFDFNLVDGRKLTVAVRMQSGTSSGYIDQPFVYVKANLTYETQEYNLFGMTNSRGEYSFYVPDNIEVNYSAGNDTGAFENNTYMIHKFTGKFDAAATNNSKTFYIDRLTKSDIGDGYDPSKLTDKDYVKPVSITSSYDITLKPYSGSMEYVLEAGVAQDVIPGQYTAKLKTDDRYFDGTVYIYPGTGEIVGLDPEKVSKITLKYNEGDVITITTEGGKYWHDGHDYWFLEKDDDDVSCTYLITSTNGSGTDKKMNYGFINFELSSIPSEIDVSASEKTMKITGNVGVDGEGELAILDDDGNARAVFDVKDGQYTMNIPLSWTRFYVELDVDVTIDGYVYSYTDQRVLFDNLEDGSVRNIAVDNPSSVTPDSEAEMKVEITLISVVGNRVTVDISVENKSDTDTTYVFSSGSVWTLETVYSLAVASGARESIEIKGYYNDEVVALGDSNFTLTVADINKTGTMTVRLDPVSHSGEVEVDHSSNDVVSASQYRYAITVKNSGNKDAKYISLSVAGSIPEGWILTYTDGKIVKSAGDFTVPGMKDTVIYICLTSVDGKGTVPSINVNVSGDVTGGSKDISLTPQSISLIVDKTDVSGGDAMNSQSGMPVGVWFMLAVGLILFVSTIYLGSKRGVFSRKN